MLEVIVLGSGSKGNATLVRRDEFSLLIDAGFSARQLNLRLEAVGQDPGALDAILVTHEHSDHVKGLRVFAKRKQIPVRANRRTLEALGSVVQELSIVEDFATGHRFEVGPFRITSFSVPHDAVDPVGFVFEVDGIRIGYATDLGFVSRLVSTTLRGCQGIVFEANHDRMMLLDGPYPWSTKQRIASRYGHLSNDHTAEGLPEIVTDETSVVLLAHMSESNNDAELASATVQGALWEKGLRNIDVRVASQDSPARAMRF